MNRNQQTYLYTDMATELYRSAKRHGTAPIISDGNPLHDSGIDYAERFFGTVRTEKLVIASEEAVSALGKSRGTYYTVHTGDLRTLTEPQYRSCADAVRYAVSEAAVQLCPSLRPKPSDPPSALSEAHGYAHEQPAVSPEWDIEGHLRNVPPAAVTGDTHAAAVKAEGEPFRSSDSADASAVTDIPPTPEPDEAQPHPLTVLAVGLGNPALTPDALGPMCVRHLTVTGHLYGTDGSPIPPALPRAAHRLCAVTPLAAGQTGIETLTLVRGAVDAVHPDLVILIDALAACETATLTATVQISTTGISPGGGVGNRRQPIDRSTLGVPVMTVGVPTVISTGALLFRAFEAADLIADDRTDAAADERFRRALAAADAGYVTPNNIEASVAAFARLTAQTVNALVLGPKLAAQLYCGPSYEQELF